MTRRLREWTFSLPSLLWLTFFFLIPTCIVITYAFRPFDPIEGVGTSWTLDTFREIFTPAFYRVALRTLGISLITTCACLVLALPTGYAIARTSPRMQSFLITLMVLPFWSNFIVRIFAWKSLLHPDGVLKTLLVFLHLASPDTILLYRPSTVILTMIYSYLPFAVLPIYAAAARFDYQLIEAGLDLGLNRLRAFLLIFIPGIRNGILTALIMVFIPAIGAYVIPDVVGGHQSEMIGNKIVQRTFVYRNLPEASALATLLTSAAILPVAMVAIIQLRNRRRAALRSKL